MSGVNSLGRKVWDKEFYSKSKEERDQIRNLENVSHEKKVDIKKNLFEESAKRREMYLDISKNVGVLKSHTNGEDVRKSISGYWCEVCKFGFNDSHSWIRHLNSQGHNQKMGTSLYVEKKSLESVKRRLSQLIYDYDHGLGIFSKKGREESSGGVYDQSKERGQNLKKVEGITRGDKANDKTVINKGEEEENVSDEETRKDMLQYDFPTTFS
ncbi:C2H2 zinc finger domain-containing protein [Cryptosporidium ubiquitum]|uniref:C2H2 zinc finger domain-containing protein n=1 Tax=Cryptosporidium ubiquitum TaxID=857276 RepID=A0A1J4M984_9CRYT|nr:C2H2 zinc finger domain-containing protein [Cryptosporidium ubiquitum]OII70774.1 C2H2 zinc finger domain-containing protein [Cryptosporidium ubiquitum]